MDKNLDDIDDPNARNIYTERSVKRSSAGRVVTYSTTDGDEAICKLPPYIIWYYIMTMAEISRRFDELKAMIPQYYPRRSNIKISIENINNGHLQGFGVMDLFTFIKFGTRSGISQRDFTERVRRDPDMKYWTNLINSVLAREPENDRDARGLNVNDRSNNRSNLTHCLITRHSPEAESSPTDIHPNSGENADPTTILSTKTLVPTVREGGTLNSAEGRNIYQRSLSQVQEDGETGEDIEDFQAEEGSDCG